MPKKSWILNTLPNGVTHYNYTRIEAFYAFVIVESQLFTILIFYQNHAEKNWRILNTLPIGGNLHHKYIQLGVITPHICASLRGLANSCATKYKNHCSNNFSMRKSHKSGFPQHINMLIISNQTFKLHFVCKKNGFQYKKYYLCAVCNHAESPNGQRLGRHTYDIRRFCTLWF